MAFPVFSLLTQLIRRRALAPAALLALLLPGLSPAQAGVQPGRAGQLTRADKPSEPE